jgi:antitoxin YefM
MWQEESSMSDATGVQYVHDAQGNAVSVIVPIDLWREIASERETAHLLKSDAMKARLLAAKQRTDGISLEDARAKLGI